MLLHALIRIRLSFRIRFLQIPDMQRLGAAWASTLIVPQASLQKPRVSACKVLPSGSFWFRQRLRDALRAQDHLVRPHGRGGPSSSLAGKTEPLLCHVRARQDRP